jgi:phage-related protein
VLIKKNTKYGIFSVRHVVRPILFVGSARKDVRAFPEPVRECVGFALYTAQRGGKAPAAKPLAGFGSSGVLEIIENYDGNTFRAVYTVRYLNAIYVLHCYMKKSKHGIAVTARDRVMIVGRLAAAEAHYRGESGGSI